MRLINVLLLILVMGTPILGQEIVFEQKDLLENTYLRMMDKFGNSRSFIGYNGLSFGLRSFAKFYDDNGDERIELKVDRFNEPLITLSDESNFGTLLKAGFDWQRTATNPCPDRSVVFADKKTFRMDHPLLENKEIVYTSLEVPEAAAYERGTAEIIDGKAFVPYSDHFDLVINKESITVILTPHSINTFGLAVVKKGEDGIYIEELRGQKGSFFSTMKSKVYV